MKRFEDWPELMQPKDVIDCLDVAVNEAFEWFKKPDFPAVDKSKCQQVGKYALRAWINKGVIE